MANRLKLLAMPIEGDVHLFDSERKRKAEQVLEEAKERERKTELKPVRVDSRTVKLVKVKSEK